MFAENWEYDATAQTTRYTAVDTADILGLWPWIFFSLFTIHFNAMSDGSYQGRLAHNP